MAVATVILFAAAGVELGLVAKIAAHTAVCIPFAFLPIEARLQGMDASLEEASMDLSAGRLLSFRRVTLPLLWAGILAGFTLAFVTSLDWGERLPYVTAGIVMTIGLINTMCGVFELGGVG